jgi:N-acetylmuramoyl-L-alanine amidase
MVYANPLPYVDQLERRQLAQISLVVMHCTELPDLTMAREYGEVAHYASGSGNSGHYYIDRDGRIEEYVPIERVANHTRGWNPRSIGIELVNTGRYPDWLDSRRQRMTEAYPAAQIDALLILLIDLRQRCPALTDIAGHEDLDLAEVAASDDARLRVRRKRDPGPMFPWAEVLAACGLRRRMTAELP